MRATSTQHCALEIAILRSQVRIVVKGRVFIRAGAETPLNFREKFRVSPRNIWKISQQWIPKPQFWYPPLRFGSQHRIPKHLFFLVFRVSTADFGFSAGRRKFSGIFLRCLSRKSGSEHKVRIKNPTVM